MCIIDIGICIDIDDIDIGIGTDTDIDDIDTDTDHQGAEGQWLAQIYKRSQHLSQRARE